MLFCVPGAKSSRIFPGTVTRPGRSACLNWRWLPRVVTRNQPSAVGIAMTSRTFIFSPSDLYAQENHTTPAARPTEIGDLAVVPVGRSGDHLTTRRGESVRCTHPTTARAYHFGRSNLLSPKARWKGDCRGRLGSLAMTEGVPLTAQILLRRRFAVVPTGLKARFVRCPTVETVGYHQLSLRDKGMALQERPFRNRNHLEDWRPYGRAGGVVGRPPHNAVKSLWTCGIR